MILLLLQQNSCKKSAISDHNNYNTLEKTSIRTTSKKYGKSALIANEGANVNTWPDFTMVGIYLFNLIFLKKYDKMKKLYRSKLNYMKFADIWSYLFVDMNVKKNRLPLITYIGTKFNDLHIFYAKIWYKLKNRMTVQISLKLSHFGDFLFQVLVFMFEVHF